MSASRTIIIRGGKIAAIKPPYRSGCHVNAIVPLLEWIVKIPRRLRNVMDLKSDPWYRGLDLPL
jgi:hypothetical protein